MGGYPNKRDCEHGRQRGKCDSCECEQLRGERDTLAELLAVEKARAEAAEALLSLVCDGVCDRLHHEKADQHGAFDPCPIEARIDAHLTGAAKPAHPAAYKPRHEAAFRALLGNTTVGWTSDLQWAYDEGRDAKGGE